MRHANVWWIAVAIVILSGCDGTPDHQTPSSPGSVASTPSPTPQGDPGASHGGPIPPSSPAASAPQSVTPQALHASSSLGAPRASGSSSLPPLSDAELRQVADCVDQQVRIRSELLARLARFHSEEWMQEQIKKNAEDAEDRCRAAILHKQKMAQATPEQVESWLSKADQYKTHGMTDKADIGRNLVLPEADSAVGLYQRVLAAQPGNPRAQKGLEEIAGFFLDFAKRTCAHNLYTACLQNAENGLKADPDNVELKALYRQAHVADLEEQMDSKE